MKKLTLILALSLFVGLTGCDQKAAGSDANAAPAAASNNSATAANTNAGSAAQPEGPDDKRIATINGEDIYMSAFNRYATRRLTDNPALQDRPDILVNEMINQKVLVAAAKAENIDQRQDVKQQIEADTNAILVAALLEEKLVDVDTESEEALRAEYDLQLKNMEKTEYKARHILLEDKTAAEDVIAQLQAGGNFEELARTRSTGPTAEKGGDLGWFRASTMVPEFSNALTNLEVGAISKAPIQTDFGWHVIKLEETRAITPPTYEESTDRLKSIIANKAAQQYLADVRSAAEIVIYDPNTGEVATGQQFDEAAATE